MINLYHNSHSREYRKYTQAHEWGCFYIRSISSSRSCICITISALFIIWALRDKNPICEGAKATRTVLYKNSSLNLNICIRKTCEVFSLENVILKQEEESKNLRFFFCAYSSKKPNGIKIRRRESEGKKVATSMNTSVLMSLGPWIRDIVFVSFISKSARQHAGLHAWLCSHTTHRTMSSCALFWRGSKLLALLGVLYSRYRISPTDAGDDGSWSHPVQTYFCVSFRSHNQPTQSACRHLSFSHVQHYH